MGFVKDPQVTDDIKFDCTDSDPTEQQPVVSKQSYENLTRDNLKNKNQLSVCPYTIMDQHVVTSSSNILSYQLLHQKFKEKNKKKIR